MYNCDPLAVALASTTMLELRTFGELEEADWGDYYTVTIRGESNHDYAIKLVRSGCDTPLH